MVYCCDVTLMLLTIIKIPILLTFGRYFLLFCASVVDVSFFVLSGISSWTSFDFLSFTSFHQHRRPWSNSISCWPVAFASTDTGTRSCFPASTPTAWNRVWRVWSITWSGRSNVQNAELSTESPTMASRGFQPISLSKSFSSYMQKLQVNKSKWQTTKL